MNSGKKQKTADLLTICIKAGKAVKGFDSAKEAVAGGSACCILTAVDISPKTLKEVRFMCGKSDIPVLVTELGKADTAVLCGKETAVIAVCDKGFAEGFGRIITR
ncbi:MAG: ribosomal L7Ae/L30e/S12e/Gadd45 family protein [Ruminococcus flavefaciens]|nr:ribosomal L7Ae/L30e/S12e/Gadd45 family protein [Ruminococcus flavefaciens]MCM1228935.1 ribosomal L7Ae/L30e/S12e/Gadd45 family protein [Ruminococcus flavefaciens]